MTTQTTPPAAVFKARTPEDLLAVVPTVLGFHPQESLVMLTFGGRRSFHARIDLPTDPADVPTVIDALLEPALRQRPRQVLFIAYTRDALRGVATALAASDAFVDEGFAVIKPLRSDGTSWFHVVPDEDPFTAAPHPYDLSTHQLTAQGVLDGRVTLGSRDQLAASVAAAPDEAAEVAAAWRAQHEAQLAAGLDEVAFWPDQREVRALVARGLEDGVLLSAGEVARLVQACADPAVRDAAWAWLTRESAEAHVDFWRGILRRTPDELVAGAAGVLGFAAWLAGHGALAWCAVDRALRADEDCSLARLVSDLLQAAVPPAAWSEVQPGVVEPGQLGP